MTREQEIEILKSLKGDTQFGQYFAEDIDWMCDNIKSDFPIEAGCKFGRKSAKWDELRKLAEKMAAEDMLEDDESDTYIQLIDLIGMRGIIRAKMDADIDLCESEIQWLCKQLGI